MDPTETLTTILSSLFECDHEDEQGNVDPRAQAVISLHDLADWMEKEGHTPNVVESIRHFCTDYGVTFVE